VNKADEKRLKKDPRYKRIVAAKTALDARIAEAKAAYEADVTAARAAYVEAAPEMNTEVVNVIAWKPLDEQVLQAIRPRGDTVRVIVKRHSQQETNDIEVESVTPTTITLVGHTKPFRADGYGRGGDWFTSQRIHEDDLARIKSGEIKGWRQKPWGGP
jgi:hypothetical protein